MPILVFRLRNVPEDEAQDIRELLTSHTMDWYETSAGNWGIAMPGIWVRNDEDQGKARELINDYQQQRQIQLRSNYEQELEAGNVISFWQRLRQSPLKVLGIIIFCAFIVYVMINPFLQLIGLTQ